jgi:hypothetical protein
MIFPFFPNPQHLFINVNLIEQGVEQRAILIAQKEDRNSDWEYLLDSVTNDQIKFEIKLVSVSDAIPEDNEFNTLQIKKQIGNPINGIISVHPYNPSNPFPITTGIPIDAQVESNLRSDLRIFIQSSSRIYKLSNFNDLRILDELINLLDEPDRAWAAHVVLAKMLGVTGIDPWIPWIQPDEWWEQEGKTLKAKQKWTEYLEKIKPTMVWSPLGGYYKYRAPDGRYVL